MRWTFQDFEADLEDLSSPVRKKALEIANDLIDREGYTEEKAIREAIKEAKKWFIDTQG